jgi:diguanylate cyclase (GGDEF)-like protein/putative nucleotidyltransferase with HDIG domain
MNAPRLPINEPRAMTAVPPTAGRADPVTLSRLNALLRVAGVVRSREDLQPLLEGVAATAAQALGFAAVVVNLRRPAWDDMEVVVVVDRDGRGISGLLGGLVSLDELDRLLDPRFDHGGVFLIPHDGFDFGSLNMALEVGTVRGAGPGGWHPEDMLLAPLRDSSGSLLGVLSFDDPNDGLRPVAAGMEALAAVAAIMASIIENAQVAAEGARRRAAVEHLLRVSSELAVPRSRADMLEAVCGGVRDALGFEKVAVYLWEQGDEMFLPVAAVGPRPAEDLPSLRAATLLGAMAPERRHEGCVLLPREHGLELILESEHELYASQRNGRGPRAWSRHWLVVPLLGATEETVGVLWADDPADRLLPSDDDLRALRTFANHAVTAIASARALETMRHLAEHDPLTGLRNRRTFEPRIAEALAGTAVSLLIADLDHFKHVNDTLGHTEGDEVLRRFAGVLRRFGRAGDLPVRLGGEEFALVLPHAAEHDAVTVAERLRAAVATEFLGSEVPVTVSIGIACGAPGGSAGTLVREANRALFAAKRLGRDRVVVHNPETLAVLGALADELAGEQLSAALLLAETLDLRDVATARHSQTVGAYAERTARALSLAPDRVERIRVAGLLHDIGKLGVSDAILQKPGALTAEEWTEIRRHPELGARILDHANLRDVARWVRGHHERMDGGGYPDGLSGTEIPLESRILAVADAYEAMTAHRPYRRALDAETARAELERHSGSQFDATVVAAFLRSLG